MRVTSAKENVRNKLASYLRGLANRRSTGVVTADDAHAFLTRQGVSEKMVRTRLAYINSVLREPEFTVVGTTFSQRKSARRRQINKWSI